MQKSMQCGSILWPNCRITCTCQTLWNNRQLFGDVYLWESDSGMCSSTPPLVAQSQTWLVWSIWVMTVPVTYTLFWWIWPSGGPWELRYYLITWDLWSIFGTVRSTRRLHACLQRILIAVTTHTCQFAKIAPINSIMSCYYNPNYAIDKIACYLCY